MAVDQAGAPVPIMLAPDTPPPDPIVPSIDEREAALVMRENEITAKEAFKEAGLPDGLLRFVVNSDANKMNENIAIIQSIWNKSMKAGLEDKLKGKAPVKEAPVAKLWEAMSFAERMALKRSSPAAYQASLGTSKNRK